MSPRVGRCWSCQNPLEDTAAVRLNQHVLIPCCAACWEQIPVSQRLLLAQKYFDGRKVANALETLADFVRRLEKQQTDGDGWKGGRFDSLDFPQ